MKKLTSASVIETVVRHMSNEKNGKKVDPTCERLRSENMDYTVKLDITSKA